MVRKAIATLCIVLWCGSVRASQTPRVRVYLPRTVQVKDGPLTLGRIGIVRSSESELAEKASEIPMGRAPWSKEKIVFGRRTILSRLATNGIAGDQVRITGAEEVTVRRAERVIPSREILDSAEAYLAEHRPGPPGARWRLIGQPEDLIVPDSEQLNLISRIEQDQQSDRLAVVVAAMAGGEEAGTKRIPFKLTYRRRQAVTTRNIAAGEKITPENTKLTYVNSDWPEDPGWTAPYGWVATRRLARGAVIQPSTIRNRTPAIAVKRNQSVVMVLEGFGFRITGLGQALEDGRPGDLIKVRNTTSKRVVTAKVTYEGSVEPVFEERAR